MVLGDAGCANMRAGARLQAASASAGATPGPIAAISLGFGSGAGGCKGPARLPRPMSRSGLQQRVGEAWVCGPHRLGSVRLGSCKWRACALQRPPGGTVRVGCIRAAGGSGLGLPSCVWGTCVGHSVWWVCRGACSCLWRVCVGCWVWRAARLAWRGRPWRAWRVWVFGRGGGEGRVAGSGAVRAGGRGDHWVGIGKGRVGGVGLV